MIVSPSLTRLCNRLWVLAGWCFVFVLLDLQLVMAEKMVNSPSSSLKLILETDKPKLVLGEPVYVVVQLRNTEQQPIRVFQDLDPEVGAIQFEIKGPKGTFGFVPYSIADVDVGQEELSPNSEVSGVFPIFYGGRGWTFKEPGTYSISAIYRDPTKKDAPPIRAQPLIINVIQEDGSGLFLMTGNGGHQAGKFLLWHQGDHLRKGIRRFEDLLEKYPNSVLGDYGRLALGRNLSRPFKDYSIGHVRKPNYKAANRYLENVRQERLPRNLQIEKYLAQARISLNLGMKEQVQEFLGDAREIAGNKSYFKFRIEEVTTRHLKNF